MAIMLGYLLGVCPSAKGTDGDCYLSRLDSFALAMSFVSSCINLAIFIFTLPCRARNTQGGMCTYIAHSLRMAEHIPFSSIENDHIDDFLSLTNLGLSSLHMKLLHPVLCRNRSLETIDLGHNRISDDGSAVLALCLSCKCLALGHTPKR